MALTSIYNESEDSSSHLRMIETIEAAAVLLLLVSAVAGGLYLGLRSTPWPRRPSAGLETIGQVQRTSIRTLGAELASLPVVIAAVFLGAPGVVLVVYAGAVVLGIVGVLAVLLIRRRSTQ